MGKLDKQYTRKMIVSKGIRWQFSFSRQPSNL